MNEFLTTEDAAKYLGVSPSRIRQLIAEKRLPSEKFGRDHMILKSDLAEFATSGKKKIGRPKKVR